jgi:hypothetical protein
MGVSGTLPPTPHDPLRIQHLRELAVIISATVKATADIENQRAALREEGGVALHRLEFKPTFKAVYKEIHQAIKELDEGL